MAAEQTESKVYAVVAETDYYGPETRRSIVVSEDGQPAAYDTREAAESAAEDHRPDYDPSVGCDRLDHNQSSATRGRVAELVTDRFNSDDWTTFEYCASDLWEVAAEYERSGVESDEALNRAIEESDYVTDGKSLYRVL